MVTILDFFIPSPQKGKQAWLISLSCFTTSSSSLNQLRLSQLWSAHFPAWDVSPFPLLHLTVQLQWLVHFKSFRCGQFKFRKSSSDWKTLFIFHTTFMLNWNIWCNLITDSSALLLIETYFIQYVSISFPIWRPEYWMRVISGDRVKRANRLILWWPRYMANRGLTRNVH